MAPSDGTAARADTPGSERHFSCSMSAVLIARVRDHGGPAAVAELLRRAGSRHSVEYLTDIANWISVGEATALWEAGARVTNHPHFARAVGEDAVRRLEGSPVANLLRSLGAPEKVYEQITITATKYSTVNTLRAVAAGPGFAEIVAVPVAGHTRVRDHCEWTSGLLSQPPVLFGLLPGHVEHTRCAAYGAEACEYRVTWPAGAGTGDGASSEPVAHEQLAGRLRQMQVRLDSMFETAADLIGAGDIDEVLARIAGRAAVEVRAPGHLLAVRMTPDGPLHLHHKGLGPELADEHAERLLSGDPDALGASWVVAEVRSTRRHYGRLLAAFDDGMRSFPQERELLEVYARYAATALDGASALDEARRQSAQAAAQLALARELAAAGTSDEMVRRLADAVPLVVDCDRVGVYLWDPVRGELTRQAYAPAHSDDGPLASAEVSWRPLPGGTLWRLVAHPSSEPLFVDDAGEDTIGVRLGTLGFTSNILVPLVARGELLGLLSVSVRDRPERLRPTPELLDRLSGVAAQATTGLQNGRLVDLITHQARHDQLTGLANRHALTTEVRAAMERARADAERGALLYVDLDRFKPVNDEFGHETGDGLLAAVAERLKGCTRSGDLVARLGGDEFAVLVVAADDAEIELVSDRIVKVFDEPFQIGGHRLSLGASVGRSLYPHDAQDADALLRRADAAMFAQKRAHQSRPVGSFGPGLHPERGVWPSGGGRYPEPYTCPTPTEERPVAGDGDLRRELRHGRQTADRAAQDR